MTAGPHPVASTNLEVDERYAALDDDGMHRLLLGNPDPGSTPADLSAALAHPAAAWRTVVDVPAQTALHGPLAGQEYTVVSFITYPPGHAGLARPYVFPYRDGFGTFGHMLAPGASPVVADAGAPYPLILLSHGAWAHGVYDIPHAQALASEAFGRHIALGGRPEGGAGHSAVRLPGAAESCTRDAGDPGIGIGAQGGRASPPLREQWPSSRLRLSAEPERTRCRVEAPQAPH